MNTNECLKNAIDKFDTYIYGKSGQSNANPECHNDNHFVKASALIKVLGLNIKACNVYGNLKPAEAVHHNGRLTDALSHIFNNACDGSDLDSLFIDVSEVSTLIMGMSDTVLTN